VSGVRLHFMTPRAWSLLGFLIACLLWVGRKSDSIWNAQFWAEDGQILYQGAVDHGLGSLLIPHAGYHHFLLRIVALPSCIVPVEAAPVFINVVALLPCFLCAFIIGSTRIDLPHRLLWMPFAALIPQYFVQETGLCLANAQWILVLVLPLIAVMDSPRGTGARTVEMVLLLALGITGPYCVMLFPLFAWMALKREPWRVARLGAVLLSSAIQMATILQWEHRDMIIAGNEAVAGSSLPNYVFAATHTLSIRLFGGNFLGPLIAYRVPWVAQAGALVALCCALIVPIWKVGSRRTIAIFLIYTGAVLSLAATWKHRSNANLLDVFGFNDRYFVTFAVALIWCALLIVSRDSIIPKRIGEWVGFVVILVMLSVSARYFFAKPLPDFMWPEQATMAKINGGGEVLIHPRKLWSVNIREQR
jgi:hypothetical protein